ncbi:hypothetical protein V6N13_013133 [Hibiscus sabdariffa]|uniref:Uncharacterized protein n=2 Tax=Hibiscus sabdariffa TaxID=183260 RepID=A0ABR1Z6I1_9ROSI
MLCNSWLICRGNSETISSMPWSVAKRPRHNTMKGRCLVLTLQQGISEKVNGTISFTDNARNRVYKLNDYTAKLFVRPRGWNLPEAHILIDGESATGCLVKFGL